MKDRIESLIMGRDPEVLQRMLDFYERPSGRIVDVTANRRKMWKGVTLPREQHVTFCDIDPAVNPDVVCDFKKTPFEDSSISLILFDPPHLPRAAGTPASLAQYKKDFGLENSLVADNIVEYFLPFLIEARRILVLDGLVFAKLSDYVHNHRYQWMLAQFIQITQSVPGMTPCDLIVKRDPCGGNLKSGRWKKVYHARNVHCWWIVVRKGKCEPR